jgi:2-polyprenyl-6-methoxyphenol hydroxylase-like FAD-dependent oxidoreductase
MSLAGPPGRGADVAVVGAGPVGLTLAVLLGQRGWRVDLYERRMRPYGLPRAVHLDHQGARILQGAGVMDDLAPQTEAMDAYVWETAEGRQLLRFDVEGQTATSGWPPSLMFHQPDLERVLRRRLAQLPSVTVHTGVEVTDLVDRDTFVELLLDGSLAGGRPLGADTGDTGPGPDNAAGTGQPGAATEVSSRAEARWLVGCDGAGSRVRQILGVPVTDLGYDADWLVVDVVPNWLTPWRPLNVQRCDPARPTSAVSGGPGRRRFEFLCLPGDPEAADAAYVWALLAPWGLDPDNATLGRHTRYRFGARMAEAWRRGHVLIAGDAAHQMPPFAGQGLCAGLRDVANLAWKLDLVLAGRASPDLLDTYTTERRDQVRTEITFSVDLGRIVAVTDPIEAAERDTAFLALPTAHESSPLPDPPPLGPGVTAPGDRAAGTLGLQAIVGSDGAVGRFDDLVGRGWVLLAASLDDLQGLEPPLSRWFAELGGRLVALADAGLPPGPSAPEEMGAQEAAVAGSAQPTAQPSPRPGGQEATGAGAESSPGAAPEVSAGTVIGGGSGRSSSYRSVNEEIVEDATGAYGHWLKSLDATVVLQRPDFYVFGVEHGPGGASRLLRLARSILTGR